MTGLSCGFGFGPPLLSTVSLPARVHFRPRVIGFLNLYATRSVGQSQRARNSSYRIDSTLSEEGIRAR